jgi:hypothetical protein
MDDVQLGKITGRRGHVLEGHFRVAPGRPVESVLVGAGAGQFGGPCRGRTKQGNWRREHEKAQGAH